MIAAGLFTAVGKAMRLLLLLREQAVFVSNPIEYSLIVACNLQSGSLSELERTTD